MTKVVYNRLFVANLKDILSYIEIDNSRVVADKVEETILKSIELLKHFPQYGRRIFDSNGKEVLYLLTINCYLVIYSYKNGVVYIENIFDSRRDHKTIYQN